MPANMTFQDISDFARLSIVLDKWNFIYGRIILVATVCGILNGTVTMGDLVQNNRGSAFGNLISLGAMLPLILVLVMASKVNYLVRVYQICLVMETQLALRKIISDLRYL